MAKVQWLNMPAELQPLIEKIFRWYDNQRYPCWGMKVIGGTRRSKARAAGNSILSQVAAAWAGIPDKSGWEAAAAVYGGTAYRLFTKDQSMRIKQGIAGVATPSTLHQYTVRKIEVSDNTTEGVAGVFRRRHISSLPATLSYSIKVNRTSATGRVVVVLICTNRVRGYYWPTLVRIQEITGDLDWTAIRRVICKYVYDRVSTIGIAVCFELGFEGTVLLDNVRIIDHGIDRYAGWRQNPGTDDWQVVGENIKIVQSIIYPED